MTQRKRMTLRDVAEAAGVSEMTVSRVLRGKGVVSKRTQEHVKETVEKIGYVQNRLAGALAENRSNQVAVILPSMTNNVFTEVMTGITSGLERADYHAVVGISDYDLQKEEALVVSMMSWRPAAIIVSNTVHSERTNNILRRTDIPVVEIMSLADDSVDINIGIDQRSAARALAEHVISKGYRRFGFLGWNEKDISAVDRFLEIEKVVREHGLEVLPPRHYTTPPNFLRGKLGMSELLAEARTPEAVFFPNDTTALGGMVHCIENNISIPKDIALVGFSGLTIGQNMPLTLTTVETKRFETGQRAAVEILNRLNRRQTQRRINMGFELLSGQTT